MSSEGESFYSALIRQARKGLLDENGNKVGDLEAAKALLRDFVNVRPVPDEVLSYVADCVLAWLETDCDPQEAASAFNVKKPAARPTDPRTRGRHIRALRAFFRARHTGHGYNKALRTAADEMGDMTESALRKLVDLPKHELERAAAAWSEGITVAEYRSWFPTRIKF